MPSENPSPNATELDLQLTHSRQEQRRRDKLRDMLNTVRSQLSHAIERRESLGADLEKEGADVRKLEGMSFTNLMVSLFGDKDRELDKEKRELAMAQLEYDEHLEVVRCLSEELAQIEEQLQSIPADLDDRHRDLTTQKEKLLLSAPGGVATQLMEHADRIADSASEEKELGEAIQAGEQAHTALREVRDQLRTAGNWGVVDMMGGGMLTTMVKHGKLNNAKQAASSARRHLARFARELDDVQLRTTDVKIEVGSLATFADYFFDGLLTDWIVQSKINRARDGVEEAITRVRVIVDSLRVRKNKSTHQLRQLEQRRIEIIGSA